MSATTSDQIATDVNDSGGLGERVRNRLPVALVTLEQRARTQWVALPGTMRGAVDRVLGRVRSTLDIPSRGEIAVLLDRIDKLDAKLAGLTPPKPKPRAKAKAKKSSAANKTARRTRIETAVNKRKP